MGVVDLKEDTGGREPGKLKPCRSIELQVSSTKLQVSSTKSQVLSMKLVIFKRPLTTHSFSAAATRTATTATGSRSQRVRAMGSQQSQQKSPASASFTGVLPGSGDRVPITRSPSTKSVAPSNTAALKPLAGTDETLRAPVPATTSSSAPSDTDGMMRIQTPAHALLLQDSISVTTRSSETSVTGSTGAPDSEFAIPESVRKSRILSEFAGVCSEILPQFLYVSSLVVAKDPSKLQELGITHVVNCCKELCTSEPPFTKLGLDLQTFELALHDDVHEDLSWFFYQVVAFIRSARDSQHSPSARVLVHCHQGISRSCAFAIAFVMHLQQQQGQLASFRDAMAFVKSKRPIASPNTAFLCQLIEWEHELNTFSSFSSASAPPENTLYRLAPHAAHDAATLVLKSCFRLEAAVQRQKVIIPLDGEQESSSDDALRRWLFSRGIFVFLRRATTVSSDSYKVVIWRGCACEIPDGVALASALVEQMARVRLSGVASAAHVDVEVVDEDPQDAAGVDCFGYAKELDWIKHDDPLTVSSTLISTDDGVCRSNNNDGGNNGSRTVSEGVAAHELGGERDCEATTPKPLLFVLEDIGDDGDSSGSWDHLKVYDSEDLAPSDAFLLVSDHHFVWIGDACSFEREAVVRCAERQVRALSSSLDADVTSELKVEQGGVESDEFWAAFERGY